MVRPRVPVLTSSPIDRAVRTLRKRLRCVILGDGRAGHGIHDIHSICRPGTLPLSASGRLDDSMIPRTPAQIAVHRFLDCFTHSTFAVVAVRPFLQRLHCEPSHSAIAGCDETILPKPPVVITSQPSHAVTSMQLLAAGPIVATLAAPCTPRTHPRGTAVRSPSSPNFR